MREMGHRRSAEDERYKIETVLYVKQKRVSVNESRERH